MKARLRSVRIAPKKANLVAAMIHGLPVPEALKSLEHTNKKAARVLERLLKSAMANARTNDNQNPEDLVVKSLVVNKAQAYHRGVPMARGRVRAMRKFLSHVEVTLGIADLEDEKPAKVASQPAKKPVKQASKSASTKSAKETGASDSASARARKSSSTPNPSSKS